MHLEVPSFSEAKSREFIPWKHSCKTQDELISQFKILLTLLKIRVNIFI
jgi:hypothetical protein